MKRSLFLFTCSVLAVVALGVWLLVRSQVQAELRENAVRLRQQSVQLAALAEENRRLAAVAAQRENNRSVASSTTNELSELRAQAEHLRQQTSQLAKRVAGGLGTVGPGLYSEGDSNLWAHSQAIANTPGGGPRAEGKLNDARVLAAALRKYADEHQGVFPLDLGQITPYLPGPLQPSSESWDNAPLSGTNQFEIAFQGSWAELTNIPPRRVAIIREQLPWLRPDGRWARTYGFADGSASIIVSDDNFQSWEALSVVPAAGGVGE
jgi:hypothetical protein